VRGFNLWYRECIAPPPDTSKIDKTLDCINKAMLNYAACLSTIAASCGVYSWVAGPGAPAAMNACMAGGVAGCSAKLSLEITFCSLGF